MRLRILFVTVCLLFAVDLYSSTSSLGILLESAVASSAPTESAFLLFCFGLGGFFFILKE